MSQIMSRNVIPSLIFLKYLKNQYVLLFNYLLNVQGSFFIEIKNCIAYDYNHKQKLEEVLDRIFWI